MRLRLAAVPVVLAALAALASCNQSDFGAPAFGDDPPPGPGSPTWNDTDLRCTSSDQCAPGETCDHEACRPRQCDDGPYDSTAPLGPRHLFFRDEEVVVVDGAANQGAYWLDGYDAAGALAYQGPGGGSYKIGSDPVLDVARIVTPDGPGVVVASARQLGVNVTGVATGARRVVVGLYPVAVGAGDLDGDGAQEIVAVAADGRIATCPLAGACAQKRFAGVTGADVAVADVDGDGADDVVLLGAGTDGRTRVVTWKPSTGATVAAAFDAHYAAVTAGDLDGDGRAEVVLLEDGGWLGLAHDRLHVYRVGAGYTRLAVGDTIGRAVDVAAGDRDGADRGDAVVVLGETGAVDLLRWNGQALASTGASTVATTKAPRRLALADLDGDSVAARLVEGPTLVPGALSPMMVVTFPPFDAATAGDALPGVAVGNRSDVATDASTTVALSAGVEVGVEPDFLGLFKAKLSTKLSTEVTRSASLGKKWSVGTRFSLRPQVDLYGDQYGAVVVGASCFHAYGYELVDPAGRAGGSGKRLTMVVPVGGATTVLSTARYGALAARGGGLPAIQVRSRIGDPGSYPQAPLKLDGTPVQPDEQVFPERPTLAVSDVATVAFSLAVASSRTNATALKTQVSVTGALGALGVQVGGTLGATWGQSYAITIGQGAEFSGEVPPLPDDPATPEDETAAHGFSFAPYVYRQPVTGPDGATGGFYVLDYAVGRR